MIPAGSGNETEKMLSRFLYGDMCRYEISGTTRDFDDLDESEKKYLYDYVAGIPAKLEILGLRIQKFEEFCKTCIITDDDIDRLVQFDHANYLSNIPRFFHYQNDTDKYFRILNYLIPPQFKKIGFEIVGRDEAMLASPSLLGKLARAIHARYLKEIKDRGAEGMIPVYPGDQVLYLMEFDSLPEEIKYSNIDNAYHIATKLFSIGYWIKPAEEGYEPLTLHLDENEIEIMARVEHNRWCWDKRLNGWIDGSSKDGVKKTHPGLVPYDELTESEKEKDRELVRMIPALLKDIGFVAITPEPGDTRKYSYVVEPKSSIHNLLNETRKLNEELTALSASDPFVLEKIILIKRKIEETIAEVRGSYDYARHIQKTFLPEDLFIRECLPDSFVLYKPKDIVSGDFYFFSRHDNIRIFASADCTGHGIPGALLSTVGYGMIDQAVNQIGLTDPADILSHIYSRVHKFLRRDDQETGIRDDMDIEVCSLDVNTRILKYAGVSTPAYLISHGELKEYKATNYADNCNNNICFNSEKIQTEKGDIIYLCSDGFTDQFGGKFHKRYQRPRLKSFLLSIHQFPMSEQKDLLNQEHEHWKKDNDEDQTDDILIIGIKI